MMFVVVSSASAVLGASAQANYAAANSFLDGFAAWRHEDTGVGVSIGWGPWHRVGMTARLDDHAIARLRRRGLAVMPADAAVDSFAHVIGSQDGAAAPAHVVVIDLDPATAEDRPLLSQIDRPAVSPAFGPHALLDTWIDGVPGMRRAAVSGFVVEEAIKVLGLPSGSTIRPRQPFHELGLDSLMAVELRNAIGAAVGTPQPATLLFDHPTTDALVDHLLDLVRAAEESRRPQEANAPATGADRADGSRLGAHGADLRRVADLTEEEAEALLLAELGEIGGGT
jgi:acyl carrier protein